MPPSYLRLNPLDELKGGKARLRILLIGVDYYCDEKSFSSLKFPAKDCEKLADAFIKVTNEFKDKTQKLTTQVVQLLGLKDDLLTANSLSLAIDEFLSDVNPKDTVIFYFAGHGKIDETTKKFYLCLSDTFGDRLAETGLDIQLFLDKLKESGVKKQVILLDACHSAASNLAARNRGAAISIPRSTRNVDEPEVSDLSSRLQDIVQEFAVPDRDFYAILSCRANQQSWECPKLGHGVFTYYLIQGLLQDAELEDQGQLFIRSLHEYVEHETTYYCGAELEPNQVQTPVFAGSGSGHRLIVGLRSPVSPPADLPDSSGGAFPRNRREEYRNLVRQTLEQQYPDYPNNLEKRSAFWESCKTRFSILAADERQRLEDETISEFKGVLSHYCKCATERLFELYPHSSETFVALRQEFEQEYGLALHLAALQEQEANGLFNQQKARYQTAAFEALRQLDETNLSIEFSSAIATQLQFLQAEIETELRGSNIEVNLTAIVHLLILEAANALAEQRERYRECCSLSLRHLSSEREQEKLHLEQTLREKYKFSADQLLQMCHEIEIIVKQDEELYESEYIRLLQQDTDT
jgi:hypothetical protein